MHTRQPIQAADLAEALASNRLALAYQPLVTADGAKMIGVEALVRWQDPIRGDIPPSTFVPIAEKSGLVNQLGEFALSQACHDGGEWDDLRVCVNVSPMQFRNPGFVSLAEAFIRAANFPFHRLELEITESAYFDDPARAEDEIKMLRALGGRVALDDFGTGYASLTHLRRLPLTTVKIDRSFVREIHRVDSAAIVHAVVALARALGLKVTAEGVETAEQVRFLRAAGCHYLQGFLFSQPVPADEISRRLRETP
jgi:EAL domain-containing protein (putative c-di-GMP-specific phosphodiesterase class I)